MLTSGEHDAVASVEDGVGHIGALSAGRTRVLLHRLQHLRRHNHGLAWEMERTGGGKVGKGAK